MTDKAMSWSPQKLVSETVIHWYFKNSIVRVCECMYVQVRVCMCGIPCTFFTSSACFSDLSLSVQWVPLRTSSVITSTRLLLVDFFLRKKGISHRYQC